ncbi:hypothetical protein Q5752_005302 [Cryptotrichosporon argae]
MPDEKKAAAIRCRTHTWADIPDWGDRFDAPIMRLPLGVIDISFGNGQELELRDYVALASTSRFFRHHLDDAFFKDSPGQVVQLAKPLPSFPSPLAR